MPGENPLASLYRMYEYIITDYNLALRGEIEYFFNLPKCLVSETPDPADPDPARCAIHAVPPQFLVMAFNRLIERGLHRDAPAHRYERRRGRVEGAPTDLGGSIVVNCECAGAEANAGHS